MSIKTLDLQEEENRIKAENDDLNRTETERQASGGNSAQDQGVEKPTLAEQKELELAARELKLEKKIYLAQKIQDYSRSHFGQSHEMFQSYTEDLFNLIEEGKLDCFTKGVDAMFDVFKSAFAAGAEKAKKERLEREKNMNQTRAPKSNGNDTLLGTIFEKGGRL